jgi:4-hydroxybenzoate polyprenyltransferase
VRAVTDRPRFLVLSESWSPGWRAALDGQPTPIYRTNYVIQGVVVPPGDHTVSLVYDPPAFRWGVAISLVALVAWLALAGWSIVVARRDKGGNRLLAFWRLLHPLPSQLTVLAAGAFVLLAARGIPPLDRLLHLLVIETAMQFSISAFNDYFDRHVDAGRPDKPVALGVIAPREAVLVGLMFAFVALALSVPLGVWLTLLTLVGLSGGLLYDAGLKYTAFSWLPFAIAFPTLPLWAWAGASPGGLFPPQLAWVVPVGAVLVLGIHLADTIPDISRDTGSGVRGLAHRLGKERALALCWGAFAASIILTLGLWAVIPYNLAWYLPGLALGAILILSGVALYLRDPSRDRHMTLLLELGALVLAVGWLAGITL